MRRRLGIAALVVSVVAAPVAGQEVKDTTDLSPIVVTATRTPRPADRVAGHVTVLTGRDLREAGYATVGEALEGLAGLTVVRTSGAGSATTLFLRGGESDYTKVLVDGIPVNEPGGAYDFAHLTTDNVERLEIVRGPTSVVYGSDAVSGVVQIVTRQGAPGYEGEVRGGTYGSVDMNASVAGGDATASYAVAGAWRRTDGLYQTNSGYDNTTFSGRLRVEPVSGTSADLALRTVSAEYRYPTDGAGNVVDVNQRQLTRVTSLGLTLEQRLDARLRGHLGLRSNAIGGGFDDQPDGPADTLGVYAYRDQRDLDRQLAEAWLDWTAPVGVTVTGGGAYELQRDRSTSESQSEFGPFTTATDARRHNWAGYGEATATRGPVGVTVGGRVDHNERFGTFLTWRGGVNATPRPGLRVFASGGTAFKEPTFGEQFGGGYSIGNPNLSPERSIGWEVGLEEVAWHSRVRVTASYFGQRFRDLIQYSYTPIAPDSTNYANLAAASADGLEIEGAVTPIAGLQLGAQYTYLHTAVTDAGVLPADDAAFRQGDALLRRPAHAWSAHARWRESLVDAYAAVRWTGARADADFSAFPATRVELPAFTVVDASVIVHPFRRIAPARDSGLELQVRNVFDATYQMAYGFPAPGRVLLVGVRVGAER